MTDADPCVGGPVRVGRDTTTGPAPTRTSVAIGFGSPADDSGVTRLDLNDIFIKHPQATFMMRVSGTPMHDAGINDGDLAPVAASFNASRLTILKIDAKSAFDVLG